MSNKKGLISIILLFLIIAIALAVMPIIMQNISYHAINEHERVFFIADSGIRYYIKSQLDTDTDWSDNNIKVTKNFGGGSFTAEVLAHPSAPEDPKSTIILRSVGQISVGSTVFRRVVRYTVDMKGPRALSGMDIVYGEGDATFDHIINGEFFGNIYLKGTYADNKSQHLDLNGNQVYQDQINADVPDVNWSYWQGRAAADGAADGTQHVIELTSASPTYTFNGTNYNGVYYVYCSDPGCTGNAALNNNSMQINGTIVATGNVDLNKSNSTVITGAGTALKRDPTVIAGNNFSIQSGSNVTLNGSVYANNSITLNQDNNLTMNGTFIFKDTFLSDHTNNVTINKLKTNDGGFGGGEPGPGAIGAYPVRGFVEE